MAQNTNAYLTEHDRQIREKLIQARSELPGFCRSFFVALDNMGRLDTTQLAYATDLGIFFAFIKDTYPEWSDYQIRELPIACLESVTKDDVEYYIGMYLKEMRENNENARARKLASLKSLYKHFYANDHISKNPTDFLELEFAKKKTDDVNYLRPNEIAILLDAIEFGEGLPEKYVKSKWYKKNRLRDLALITLLLGTGIRVSECVGLDVSTVDFDNASIYVVRKGRKAQNLPMGDEVQEALSMYLSGDPSDPDALCRAEYEPDEKAADALFLASSHGRLTVRGVEKIVHKYVEYALPAVASRASFSPHKMRASFGTNLYAETGDLKAVADLLGHTSSQTTETFYIARSRDERRREAVKDFKLRG